MARKSEDGSLPGEFAGRIGRLLLTLIKGATKPLPEDDKLRKQLNDMAVIVKEGVKVTPVTDLDKNVEEYFDRLTQNQKELQKQRIATKTLTKKLEESEAKALVDSLTEVLNRNAYNMEIVQLVHEFKRYNEKWALLVLDIDHFKSFNDKYGHKTGDKVLKSVAATVTKSIRASDNIFRYGGEEFVVILSRVDIQATSKLAEKTRKEIEKSIYIYEDKKLKVTVSIGAAVMTEKDTETTLFERADKALYRAKDNGRNQVELDI